MGAAGRREQGMGPEGIECWGGGGVLSVLSRNLQLSISRLQANDLRTKLQANDR